MNVPFGLKLLCKTLKTEQNSKITRAKERAREVKEARDKEKINRKREREKKRESEKERERKRFIYMEKERGKEEKERERERVLKLSRFPWLLN